MHSFQGFRHQHLWWGHYPASPTGNLLRRLTSRHMTHPPGPVWRSSSQVIRTSHGCERRARAGLPPLHPPPASSLPTPPLACYSWSSLCTPCAFCPECFSPHSIPGLPEASDEVRPPWDALSGTCAVPPSHLPQVNQQLCVHVGDRLIRMCFSYVISMLGELGLCLFLAQRCIAAQCLAVVGG